MGDKDLCLDGAGGRAESVNMATITSPLPSSAALSMNQVAESRATPSALQRAWFASGLALAGGVGVMDAYDAAGFAPELMEAQEAGARRPPSKWVTPQTLFFVGLLLAGSGVVSPPVALVGGVAFGMTLEHPLRKESSALAKVLLQASVVLLGFGIDLHEVVRVGKSGFAYTAVSIFAAMGLGLLLGKVLRVKGRASYLIAAGTAICGGSAIAAIAPILGLNGEGANDEEISVAMGTVFLLNSVALLLFPAVGWAMHLSQSQFGLWAALAIHDTSSVVGASAKYGAEALRIGTTVKLARALWIVPVSLVTAAVVRRQRAKRGEAGGNAKVALPWFIGYFCVASVLSTYVVRFAPTYAVMNHLGKLGLTATLFLIGTSLSRKMLRQVGVRPLVQGVALWAVLGSVSLLAIAKGWIGI